MLFAKFIFEIYLQLLLNRNDAVGVVATLYFLWVVLFLFIDFLVFFNVEAFYSYASSCENNFFSKSFTIFFDDEGLSFYIIDYADISPNVRLPIDGNLTVGFCYFTFVGRIKEFKNN